MDYQKRIEELEEASRQCLEQAERLRALVQQETEAGYIPRVGEIAEFRDSEDEWIALEFKAFDDDPCYPYRCGMLNWEQCRPLSNPLVLQFREHVPGDPMPCDGVQSVTALFRSNITVTGRADVRDWGCREHNPSSEIIGWLPVGARA